MKVYHWHIDSLTIFHFLESFPHVEKWETTDCTNNIIWISQDKWKHFPWSLLLFWVYLVLKRKKNVLIVTKVSYKVHSFGVNSRLKFKEQAEKWSKLKIHKNNEYIYIYIYTHIYTLVHSKLNYIEELFGKSLGSCQREFDVRYINSVTKFGRKSSTENDKSLSVVYLGYLLQYPKESF